MNRLYGLEQSLGPIETCPKVSNEVWRAVLSASTDLSLTVPTGATKAIIVSSGDYYVAADVAATVPASATFAKENGELNKAAIDVTNVTTLHFISSGTPTMCVSFFV